jgi:hypothetical protein
MRTSCVFRGAPPLTSKRCCLKLGLGRLCGKQGERRGLLPVDTECDLLPLPYAIYDRVRGLELASPLTEAPIWRELGRDLARTRWASSICTACFRARSRSLIRVSWSTCWQFMAGSRARQQPGCSPGSSD